jgi:hypothetical protein
LTTVINTSKVVMPFSHKVAITGGFSKLLLGPAVAAQADSGAWRPMLGLAADDDEQWLAVVTLCEVACGMRQQ